MKKEKNLDELFRDKLRDYEQEPPAYLLDNILESVAGARRKKRLVFWRVAGVAAALLLAFVAGWQLNDRKGQEIQQKVAVTQSPVSGKAGESKATEEKSTAAEQASPANLPIAQLEQKKLLPENYQSPTTRQNQVAAANANAAAGGAPSGNDEPVLLKPLKSLLALLKTETSVPLQEKKEITRTAPPSAKTIDQQIMELNKQMLTAENNAGEKARWSFGAQVSPEYNGSRSSYSKAYASNMLKTSSTPVDLSGGISLEYKKGKRWSLQSGVYYSGIGQTSGNSSKSGISRDYLFANLGSEYFNTAVSVDAVSNKVSMNGAAGMIEFASIPSGMVVGTNIEDKSLSNAVVVSNAQFIQNFQYIEIPLFVRYTLVDARFDIEMLGGFSSNVLVGNKAYMESNSERSYVGKTRDMETLNYSGTIGLGFRYGLSKRVSVNVEPRLKYFLNSLSNNSAVTYKPYTIGVFTGLSYEF